MLEARRVGEAAERAFLALPIERDEGFESVYSYLVVDEPAVHLMPLHFCPAGARRSVGAGALHALGVAAKLEYARNRWVDEVVDAGGGVSLTSAHRLHDTLLALINDRYSKALGNALGGFLPTLADLHARYAMSLALDGRVSLSSRRPMSLDDYVQHARARHGPYRAPIDAVLILAGTSEQVLQKARASWHSWALGVQLYDDAVDVEEDFRNLNPSWTVQRALEGAGEIPGWGASLGPDAFYETALSKGAVVETLDQAESFFKESCREAGRLFPSWAALQRSCLVQTRKLREDLQAAIQRAGKA